MFWRRFAKRTGKSSEQLNREVASREALKARLLALLQTAPSKQYTIRHLERKLAPATSTALAIVLAELQDSGYVDRIIRVESPESHGGIQDFTSPDELPEEIFDWRTQKVVPVEPSNTSFIFQAHTAPHSAQTVNV